MTREDAAFIADALLALCDQDSERPFYCESTIRSKLKLAERREPLFAHWLSRTMDPPLLRDECRELILAAGLTERQLDVLGKRLEGWTFEEIGVAGGHSKQGAQHIFVQALKKLARAFRVYPFKGLSEVYRQEVRRGVRQAGLGRMPVHVHR
jgi:hypothetical protein